MTRIHFTVLGNPQAQKRHRTGKWGRYDPSESDKADFLALCRDNAPEKPIEGAVILRLVFWMPVPKGSTKRFKVDVEDFDIYIKSGGTPEATNHIIVRSVAHTKARFDIDNQIKFVMDALAGVYWANDGQVQIGWAYKIYSHRPRTELEIIF
jgi:Holliday junction resolvase